MRKAIRRGDLFYADLNPVVGSEQGGIRPVPERQAAEPFGQARPMRPPQFAARHCARFCPNGQQGENRRGEEALTRCGVPL